MTSEPPSLPADMKPAPQRRPWFQVHLSTCVVLMFVASGLLWANVRVREVGQVTVTFDSEKGSSDLMITVNGRGWPLVFDELSERNQEWTEGNQLRQATSMTVWDSSENLVLDSDEENVMRLTRSAPWALVLDVLVALAVLALVGFLCERPIRRRQRAG
jgi:hypothetical protein